MTLLLGHGTPIQGIQSVKAFPDCNLLMITEAREWLHACAQMKSTDQSLHTAEMQAVAATAEHEKGTIPKDADRFVILSTLKSFSAHVKDPLTLSCNAPIPATSAGSRSKGARVSVGGARFARAFRDECHDEKGRGTTFNIFDGLRKRAMPAIWMLSGTPFETSPSSLHADRETTILALSATCAIYPSSTMPRVKWNEDKRIFLGCLCRFFRGGLQ